MKKETVIIIIIIIIIVITTGFVNYASGYLLGFLRRIKSFDKST